MSSIPISLMEPGIPVIFWVDAVLDAMSVYYGGRFAGIASKQLRIGHDQEQLAIQRASYAVYASEWAAQTVRTHGYEIEPEKMQVIRFGANLPIAHDLPAVTSLIDARLAKDKCVLLFIGVDWERKGGAIALETTRLLNQRGIPAVLQVVGCEAPDEPFVERLGFISKNTKEGQARLRQLLNTATFFLLPTRAEAAGVVFCEASAFGLPIVATATGGVESYVLSGKSGFCLPPAAGPEEYADAIETTWKSPELYRSLSLGAFSNYQTNLNWDSAVSRLLELADRARTKTATPN